MKNATIIVPAYNEENNIENLLKEIKSVGDYEIIVVDDGSEDRTADIAQRYAKVLRFGRNMGKGYACRSGAKLARSENLVFIDGDGQLFPRDIPKFLKYLDKFDLVVGKRPIADVPFQRRIANNFAKWMMRKITKTQVDDYLCGFRAIRKRELEKLGLKKNRYEFESEMLIKAAKKSLKIKNIPTSVKYEDYRGMPLTQSLRVALYLVKEALK